MMTAGVVSGAARLFRATSAAPNGWTRRSWSQWKALRTTNALERINEEFSRRTNTQASLPNEEAVLLLPFGLLRSGQVKLRRLVCWQDIPNATLKAQAA